MIQAIKDTRQCSRCGCIALPDATKCPKCGATYNGDRAAKETNEIVNTIRYLSGHVMDNLNTQVVRAQYQLTCGRHGRIYIKATVISSPIRCPFC